jgi:hypothetical protein
MGSGLQYCNLLKLGVGFRDVLKFLGSGIGNKVFILLGVKSLFLTLFRLSRLFGFFGLPRLYKHQAIGDRLWAITESIAQSAKSRAEMRE